jgi:uncharacterized protein (DUF697 family)
MNRSLFLHVVERLEGLVGKLPATIQKPILSELTPLKDLFLRQRSPRFLITGPNKAPLSQIVSAIFPGFVPAQDRPSVIGSDLWKEFVVPDRGTIWILDAREASIDVENHAAEELQRQPADLVIFVDEEDRKKIRKDIFENLLRCLSWNDQARPETRVIGIVIESDETAADTRGQSKNNNEANERTSRLQSSLEPKLDKSGRLLRVFKVQPGGDLDGKAGALLKAIGRELPNEARIEMARISRDKEAQIEIAHLLVKSTTAICTAIGMQPIPLADLPILTTLQLVMVSGIMYVSGRERSLRAATEFVAALGANVGAGMLLREGTRAILKFIPGWGNLVCGMVAGAGTYAIGRSAIVYFLEGASLKDARRTYLASRKPRSRPSQPALPAPEHQKKELRSRGGKGLRGLRLRR